MKEKKPIIQLLIWTWSWVATLALASFGPMFIWDEHLVFTSFAIILNLINGIFMIWVNRKLFNHYDELERKIQLESMGMTLGLSVIVGLTLSLLKKTNLLSSFNLNNGIDF